MVERKIGIVGLGLIGGSIALALKNDYEILGCDTDEQTVKYCRDNGICTVCEIADMKDCAVVFVCVPLWCMKETLARVAQLLPDAIISDVGSVKTPFEGICARYVGGHPMAGVERGGIERAKSNLFTDAYWVITDTSDDGKKVSEIVTATGAIVVNMSASEHDISVARYSHAPHAAAYALVTACSDIRPIAGSGFLDTTRIAQSDEKFWSEVFALNGRNVSREIKALTAELEKLNGMIERGEHVELVEYLRNARVRREALNRVDLGGDALYVDLCDRIGEFERVTGLVARAGVSMANIALVPIREGAAGALRLEFSSAADKNTAKKILSDNGYCANESL